MQWPSISLWTLKSIRTVISTLLVSFLSFPNQKMVFISLLLDAFTIFENLGENRLFWKDLMSSVYSSILTLHKKWNFPLRISSVNETKSADLRYSLNQIILRISPYSVRMRETTDQNNSPQGHYSDSVLGCFLNTSLVISDCFRLYFSCQWFSSLMYFDLSIMKLTWEKGLWYKLNKWYFQNQLPNLTIKIASIRGIFLLDMQNFQNNLSE